MPPRLLNEFLRVTLLTVATAITIVACTVPQAAPTSIKSEEQIAREIVDCMIENDPEQRLAILAMGGKDAMAEYTRQLGTKRELAEERDRVCATAHQDDTPQRTSTTQPNQPTPYIVRAQPMQPVPTSAPSAITWPSNPPRTAPRLPKHPNSLTIHYDGSATINNRQVPQNQRNCSGGSSPVTRWSKTIELPPGRHIISDADGEPAVLTKLDFAQIHPGRRYSDHDCPDDQYTATATFTSPQTAREPNLVGYTAEWRDAQGNLIGTDEAHDGISLALEHDQKPEDLYNAPATFHIYDSYAPNTKPADPEQPPAPHTLTYQTDPGHWPVQYQRREIFASSRWHETGKHSPDYTGEAIQIADANGNIWTLSQIFIAEKFGHNKGYDQIDYTILLTNDTKAVADFTGYQLTITTTDGKTATSHWDPLEHQLPLESAQFQTNIYTETSPPFTLQISDLHR